MAGTTSRSTWPAGLADGVAALGCRIEAASASFGKPVRADWIDTLDPGGAAPPDRCQLLRCVDGWVALNLARPDDHALVAAWLALAGADEPRDATGAALVDAATLLGLPVSLVGECSPDGSGGAVTTTGPSAPRLRPRVVDLSALWAGPLCGAVLAAAGCDVVKVESTTRPDALRVGSPSLFGRLNGAKAHLRLDLSSASGRASVEHLVHEADIVITAARARALGPLGLEPSRHDGTWVSITGYGLASTRVAFGDDAAAAGGLVTWHDDRPSLIGRSVADPLAGLTAAAAVLELLANGHSGLVDVAMARVAAAHA